MKKVIAIALVMLISGGIAMGQEKSAAKPIPDICKGVIDPYDISGEKALFYASAGVDNELTSAEFEAGKAKPKAFARKFDSWRILITFDKDKNGKIDWNEAGAYRHETRQKVMGAFDKNKDGKLTGEERTAANKALASGRISLGSRSAERDARRAKWRAEMLAKYDKDKDGKLSEKEESARRQAYEAAAKERRERYQAERDLREHDADKDGKLSTSESAARDKARADYEKRRADFMKKHDTNGDGRLSGDEWKTAGPAIREAMQKRMMDKYDKNKDGKLDKTEEAAVQAERDKRRKEYRDRYEVRRFDKNKDGKLDGEEVEDRDKWRKSHEAERAKRRAEYIKKYDKNGDGEVDDKERPARSSRGRGGRGRGGPGGGDRGGRGSGDRGGRGRGDPGRERSRED